ncbi:glutamine--fructose-6-phosphate transaminase (isomerizing) [Amphritea pacifica]|uniref:Glutamine--fructose-6-phosphate aminotransferase [isomerizing] n=1 Tax=Amphritea pacifica TaxID=2811233 RepID=A0ABS2W268_9GAMM|nr:glutamine--fructose-6-phosphate transaminase (isomerizing) [Amphritea pacifica]MBN0985804.1 glutamine--fructose-6-phosphate transaminase (isomerizing) [Amphritea pacifica]MBN1005885.1 glutamine--fructose-6-phosphate transaminase (isomerizing) [Amphritea pacifica]
MCGIVGAIAGRNISAILLEGLKRLEYRGYDSAGMAVLNSQTGELDHLKRVGKVAQLDAALTESPLPGYLGIAHTRWATHGKPEQRNAHPHLSADRIAVVHNGIIENHTALKAELVADGYQFLSDTDTEVVTHLIYREVIAGKSLEAALKESLKRLDGAYALAVIDQQQPDLLLATRMGSPLVIGVGVEENFIASDPLALLQVTDRFLYLEEGDVAAITRSEIKVENIAGESVSREVQRFEHGHDAADKGLYRHYMLKEIYEQPDVIARVLEGRIHQGHVLEQVFGSGASELFDQVKMVQIVACGTSYNAGVVARYWIEKLVGIPCMVEVASEFRYRKTVCMPGTLFITISQSGETADTLSALREAKEQNYLGFLSICNVAGSSLVRESDLAIMTNAGPEIGVASTKAFTSQLVVLMLTTLVLARRYGFDGEQEIVAQLEQLIDLTEQVLALDPQIQKMAEHFVDKHHALFLGRGTIYPVAVEGALKLKEISYIHAEAYPAGELKHGPLALVDEDMPVVAIAPNNSLLEKLQANLEEVRARGGKLFLFADSKAQVKPGNDLELITLPDVPTVMAPIIYSIPLQLLAYYVACLKGTDVDQPRNLAKSVTVE